MPVSQSSPVSLLEKSTHPVLLVVADDTEEFACALKYAAYAAEHKNARLAVLHVLPDTQRVFMPWKSVNDVIERGQREEGERVLEFVASKLEKREIVPSLYLRKGNPTSVVKQILNEDECITQLILAADTNSSNPGPLVSYFSSKGLREISVPVTIVPGHLSEDTFDSLFPFET